MECPGSAASLRTERRFQVVRGSRPFGFGDLSSTFRTMTCYHHIAWPANTYNSGEERPTWLDGWVTDMARKLIV